MLTRTFFAPLMGFLIALAVGLAGEYGYRLQQLRLEHDLRSNVISTVGQYRAALEGQLNASLYLTNGLIAYIDTHNSLAPAQVQTMLKTLYEQGMHVRNIGLAPDNRLTYIYPLQGNEKAIGLYYPDLPEQWPAVKQAIEERKPRLAGPVQLKQGGTGFIYRVPVFVGRHQKYWGMLSMVIDRDTLFTKAGIAPEVNGLQLALRGKDGEGAKGEVIMGDAALFGADSIKAAIVTPGGTWQLAAKPVGGWTAGHNIGWLRASGWVGGILLGTLLYYALASVARRLQAEQAVRNSRDELNDAQRLAMIGSWSLDLHNNRLTWSDEIFRIFEIDPTRFGASYESFLNAIHPDDRELVDRAYNDSLANHTSYEITHRLLFADGRIKYVRERGETLYDADGAPLISRGTVQDITQMHQTEQALRESEERWKFALEGAGDGVWDWNLQTGEMFLSRQEMTILGYDGEGPLHTHIADWVERMHPDDLAMRKIAIERYLAGKEPLYHCEFRLQSRDGGWRWILARGMVVSHTPDGKPLRMIGTHADISARKMAEAELVRLATTDSLTGISSRRHFFEELESELSRVRRSGAPTSLLMMDIDHFKNINDTHGHAAGDLVLRQFCELAGRQLRRSDRFGRLGGEEFALLLPDTDEAGAMQFAERFRRSVADTPVQSPQGSIPYTVSIGVAIFRADDASIDSFMARADAALYRAKAGGRNRVEADTVHAV